MKTILVMTVLAISLSCKTPPKTHVTERCKLYLKDYHTDVIEDYCYCESYEISKKMIGPHPDATIKEAEYCIDQIGFPPKKYGNLIYFLDRWRNFLLKFD